MSFYICKECFYKYRCTRLVQCPHNPSTGNGVFVKWNGKGGRLETTERSIRPIPTHLPAYVNNIVMCDPKTCRKDECMYAHGQEEQREWNRILSSQKGKLFQNIYANHEIKEFFVLLSLYVCFLVQLPAALAIV